MSISDIRNNGLNPLSYLGVQSYSPLNFIKKTFDPTSNDSQNFTLGTVWLNTAASPQRGWMLVSLAQGVATWVLFVSGVGEVTTLHTQDGNDVTPTLGVINISGGNNLTTTGTAGPNTVTISLSGITQHSVQVGGASNALTQIANGTTGQVLTAQTGADPIWAANPGTGAVTTLHTQDGNNVTATAGVINLSGGNSLTTTGTVGPNTATISLTGVTQYNVQTGGASNALNNVAPSATSGVPLISQGAASQPVFGTAVVAGGGTGDTSFTAYSVICGGTTSTGNLQNVVGVGTAGQILTSNGAGALPTWQANSGGNAFETIVTQVFTSNGTYTPTANMQYCIIEVVGGGGGGGGASTSNNTQASAGAGGGGGGYARGTYSAATIGASQSVTVGAAGTAGSAGNNSGGNGGTTSVGALLSATGGAGGSGNSAQGTVVNPSSDGGVGSGGDYQTTGSPGFSGFGGAFLLASGAGATSQWAIGGQGGSSFFGGGAPGTDVLNGASEAGIAGKSYGGGGSGGCTANASQVAGGAGVAGIVIVTEFIS